MKNNIINLHNQVSIAELESIFTREVEAVLKDNSMTSKLPVVCLHGSPGIGKTSIFRSIAQKLGIEFLPVMLSQMEPCDIKGLPVPNKEEHTMDWYVNGTWPRDPNSKGILFLDEITSIDRSVAVAAYELILERKLGKLYTLPPGWIIACAGNLSTDKAVANILPSALANRMMHFELKADSEVWLKWGLTHNIHPSVMAFIRYKPQHLMVMENQNLGMGWPSPRSWEKVSEMLYLFSNETEIRKIVYGLIGTGVGAEFMEFHKNMKEYENILKYMLDPDCNITIPNDVGEKYAIVSAMNYHLWRGKDNDDTDNRVAGFLRICNKLSSDFSSVAIMSAYEGSNTISKEKASKKLYGHPLFKEWSKKHGKNLKKYIDIDV